MASQPTVQQIPIEPITVTGIFYNVKPFIVYPARWLGVLLLLILRPVVIGLRWLSWPILSFVTGLWSLATLPITVLRKFEAFLTFLLVAAIIGAIAGLCLHTTSSVTNRAFGIEYSAAEDDNDTSLDLYTTEDDAVRSVADFREARKVKKEQRKQEHRSRLKLIHSPREEKMFQDMLSRVDYKSGGGMSDSGAQSRLSLSAQTILEEDDSSSFEQT